MHHNLQRLSRILLGAALVAGTALIGSGAAQAQGIGTILVAKGPVSEAGKSSFARCPDRTSAINGGYSASPIDDDHVVIDRPIVDVNNEAEGWEARMLRGKVIAYAICVPVG